MKKTILYTASVIFVILSLQSLAESESFKTLTIGLQDGIYIIERIDFMPFPSFASEKEAKAWLESFKKNPSILKPEHDFFQLYLAGDKYIIHQLNQTETGEYEPKGNFFVSVSGQSAWAFEENANRVTIITNFTRSENSGPVAGLLKTGDDFCNELRHLGMEAICLPSDYQTDNNKIAGKNMRGDYINGVLQRDDQGQITNVIYKLSNSSNDREFNINIARDETAQHNLSIIISSRRNSDQLWQDTIGFIVRKSSPLLRPYEMNNYWSHFSNSNTLLVVYDTKNKITLINKNGITRPLGKSDVVNNLQHIGHARWLALVLLTISTIFGAAILIKMLRHPNK